MLYTEPRLGAVVLFIAVPQLLLVPMIQRHLNVYVRERAHTLVRAGDLMVDPALHRGPQRDDPQQSREVAHSRGENAAQFFNVDFTKRT
jgi:hypothetical protein